MSTIGLDGARVFLGDVVWGTETVVASPALAAETIIGSLTLAAPIRADQTVFLWGWAAYTVGTTGTAGNLRIRQTAVAGTLVVATGALTQTAANLVFASVSALDAPGAVANQVYVLTLQVTAATAASTVSALSLYALIV